MIRTFRHALLWAAFVTSITAVLFYAWSVYTIHRENQLILQLISGQDVDVNKVITGQPELRLARAIYFKQKHRYDDALSTLSLILDKGDRPFQAKARYNLGNLYLEQAVQKVDSMNMNEALPLAGLENNRIARPYSWTVETGMPNTISKSPCVCCRKWTKSTARTRSRIIKKHSFGLPCPDFPAVCLKLNLRGF